MKILRQGQAKLILSFCLNSIVQISLAVSFAILLGARLNAKEHKTSSQSYRSNSMGGPGIITATTVKWPVVEGADIRFTSLAPADRLSQTKVSVIVQDDQGLMWFATSYGLYRYDGYNFKVFSHDPSDPNSLSGVAVTSLFKDRDGALWIGCDQFLNKLNLETESFARYEVPFVTHISQDKEGMLWLATPSGLYRLDPANGRISHYFHDPDNPSSLSSDHIVYSGENRAGTLWVATPGYLDEFDRRAGAVTRHVPIPDTPYGFGFYEDRVGILWIFHVSPNPLSALDLKTNTLTRCVFPREPADTAVTRVTAMLEDQEGTLWIGTHGPGLLKFDREHKRFIQYQNDPRDPGSIPQNNVDALFSDREGSIWVGLGSMGPVRFTPKLMPFARLVYAPGGPTAQNPFVGAIYEDRQGILWIGTPKALNRIDRRAGSVTAYRNGAPEKNTDVIAICEDTRGFLWVGTYGHGLLRFDRRTGKFKTYRLIDDFVSRLLVDHNGTLWAGTTEGLSRFDPTTDTFSSYKLTPHGEQPYLALIEDREGALWLGADSAGLQRFDPATGRLTVYRHDMNRPGTLSDNRVNSVTFDHTGTLWVGTQNGLDRFDPKTMTFTVFTRANGLPGNAVGCILEDTHGYLWMSTNNGVARFEPRTGSFSNYSTADGLPGLNLTGRGACFKSANGEMFFGGFSGATAFFPDMVSDNSKVPPVVLTGFRLFGTEVSAGPRSLLKKSINYTDAITLTHSKNIFSIEFSALSYLDPVTNRYRYMLEGLDHNKWNEVSSDQRFASYTTLPAGIYTFRLQGATRSGAWSEPGVQLRIEILPPWWGTLWFRAIFIASLLLVVTMAYKYHVNQIAKTMRARFDERLTERARIARELHDTLLQNLHGVMFQFQAARNMVSKRPEEAIQTLDSAIAGTEKAIAESQDAIEDLRSKQVPESDLPQLLTETGNELASARDASQDAPVFRVIVEGERRSLVPALQDEIYRVAREALRNAFRHARARQIEAEIRYDVHEFRLRIRDDGKGMAQEVLEEGKRAGHWGLPGIQERAQRIGGKLDVWSEADAGTEVQLTIPAAIAYEKLSASAGWSGFRLFRRVKRQ